MLDMERLSKTFATTSGFRAYAKRFQFWRLCSRAACLRAQACRDQPHCHRRFAAWAEAAKEAIRYDHSYNPEAEALRLELAERLQRMHQMGQLENDNEKTRTGE
ncbi:MAG TPA: hypothetical protein VNJ31_00790 [Methyloceanibacter sp.]|nr:hypothetical protein [Methyloceanibacter sp.]